MIVGLDGERRYTATEVVDEFGDHLGEIRLTRVLREKYRLSEVRVGELLDRHRAKHNWLARFEARVERRGECLIWTGGVNNSGYPATTAYGRQVGAHRLSYELAHGQKPVGTMVTQTCGNKRCVSPEHLRLTALKDMVAAQIAQAVA